MDKSRHPHVIRTWVVERTRHAVRTIPTNKPADRTRSPIRQTPPPAPQKPPAKETKEPS